MIHHSGNNNNNPSYNQQSGYASPLPYGYADQPVHHTQSARHQQMWPIVRRIFPSEENLIKFLFTIHLAFIAFFALDRNVQLNNWYLEFYNTWFLYFLTGLFFLTLFWTLLMPGDYNPMDLAQLIQLVTIAVDIFVLFKLYSRYSLEGNVDKYIFWNLLFLVRLITFILLRKMWADRCTAALAIVQGMAPAMAAPVSLPPANQQKQMLQNRGGAGAREYPIGSRDAYLYQASLNA